MGAFWANFLPTVGILEITIGQVTMILLSFLLAYLAIVKKYEPLLLIPISFGMMIANMPIAGLTAYCAPHLAGELCEVCGGTHREGGLLWHIYQILRMGILPPMIFLGLGAITDFSPLIANKKYWVIGIGGQFGIFTAFGLSRLVGNTLGNYFPEIAFTAKQSATIAIIGSSDGPTAIFTSITLAPELLSVIAIAAYSYMALVPIIQPPIMKLLTTAKERVIVMPEPRQVTQRQRILFPIFIAGGVLLLVPSAGPLIAMFMLGNLIRESKVAERISHALQGDFLSILTMFVGLCIGVTSTAYNIINFTTIVIIVLGLLAFAFGTVGGILTAKILNVITGGKVNPLIGNSGVSAMPMAARVSQKVALEYNPNNFVIMHAMGPILASTIGSAVVAGIFISLLL